MMYAHGAFVTGGLSFAELKAHSLINARAKAADASPDFSELIRVGLPTPKSIDTKPSNLSAADKKAVEDGEEMVEVIKD
jgi:hypothetical protein